MYLHASIGIDPSKLTELTQVKPTRVFAKLFYYLTAGLVGEQREVETFTAVSILQQLNMAMRSQGVTNIVRLAVDGLDLYLDEEGRPDDIDEAMKRVEVHARTTQDTELANFGRIVLVLEHEIEHLRLLIQAEVDRVHPPDEFPILVRVDGLMNDFKLSFGESTKGLRARMAPSFRDQDRYDALVANRMGEFEDFVNALADAIGQQIHSDELTTKLERRLIRPKDRLESPEDLRGCYDDSHDDLLYGYYGFDDAFMYAWLWSSLSHDHGVHIREVSVIDEAGRTILDVGPDGFDAGSVTTLDPDAAFEVPDSPDVTFYAGSDYDRGSGVRTTSVDDSSYTGRNTDAWLDDMYIHSGFDHGGFSSCGSSCGGCHTDW